MTSQPVQPANVYALVVGVEKYQAGAEYDLNGPANDAIAFTRWLLGQGVDPEHVYLFLSPLDKNRQVLLMAESLGMTPLPAIHDLISAKIRSRLTSEHGSGGDVLYVFWGGHGIITKTDATIRRLLFADTDDDTKWNLNVNSLVEALSTAAHGAGFDQQIFLLDACANAYYQGLSQTIQGEAAEVKFAASGDVDRGDQFILFASAAYEVATNESDAGTGSFSKAVLTALQRQPLLPEMLAVTQQVQTAFLEQQKLEPVYWWRKLRGNEEELDNTRQSAAKGPVLSQKGTDVVVSNRKLPSFKQVKLSALEKRQNVLIRQYEAASNQLSALRSAADRVIVGEEIKLIEHDLLEVEAEIAELSAS
jgi:Caspase domain/Effector-associated domain 9